jgi:LysM repeat protein/GTP cyclohydrolase FolE2
MPCSKKITQLLRDQIYNEARPALSRSLNDAQKIINSINEKYGEKVVGLIQGDTLDLNVYVPLELVDKYYENELMMEMEEIRLAQEEARDIQRQDARRAGQEYTDDYLYDNTESTNLFSDEQIRIARDREIANKLGEKYKKAFGIEYQTVSMAEAAVILQDSPTPYTSDVAAFFYNNQVYFINGKFNSNSVIHEFAHPLVKAIQFQNPTLFANLFGQLATTATGMKALDRVRSKYPELKEDTERFMEEAIVTAMELDAEMKLNKIKSDDSAFQKFIQNLLYALKQVIKALTKKVSLKKLSTSTDLNSLVDMMINEDFVIEDLQYQLNVFAEFKKDTDSFLKELKSIKPENLVNAIDRFHDEMNFQLNQLKISPKKLREELGKDGIDIIKNIRDYVSGYEKAPEEATDEDLQKLVSVLQLEQQDMRTRSLAFVNSLNELEMFGRRIQKILYDLKQSGKHLTEEGNQKIQFFKEFMEREVVFLKDVNKLIGLDPSTDMSKKIYSIKNLIENNIEEAGDLTIDFVKKFFVKIGDTMQSSVRTKLNEAIDKILKTENYTDQEIEDFKNKLYDQLDVEDLKQINVDSLLPRPLNAIKYLNRAIKNYNSNKITEASVDAYLRGHVKDVSMAGALMNPVANINDMFGVFAQYMRDQQADAAVETERKQMQQVDELKPYLNAAGWNPNSTNQLADMTLFVDKVGDIDKDGNFKEYEINTFLNQFQNYRADKAKLENDLKIAKDKNDKTMIADAMKVLSDFNKDYMIRRYTDEVYEAQNIWKQENRVIDPATNKEITVSKETALEAYLERKEALDDLKTYNVSNEFTELDDLLDFTGSDNARTRYNDLFNPYDNDGKFKQGKDLEKVLIRRLYREESRKFYESTTNVDKFQKDLDHFVNVELAGMGVSFDSDPARYEEQMTKFFNKNLKIAYSDEYYQSRNSIIDEIKKINEKGKGSEISTKLAGLYEQRYNIVNRVTDKDGEPNASELGEATIKRLKDIEEEIIILQDQFDRKTGLSKEEAKKLRYYEEQIIGKGKGGEMTADQKQEYADLTANKSAFGLSPQEITYLRGLYRELSELTDITCTEYYTQSFNKALGDLKIEELTQENADSWINSENVLHAKANNTRFSEWFDKNHYKRNSYNNQTGLYEDRYFRLKAWSVSRPSDSKYYKSTEITDPSTGKTRMVPGVPIPKYSYMRIKDKYKTGYNSNTGKVELKVGEHIDNTGNFLPKDYTPGKKGSAKDDKYINKKYTNLKASNNAQFKLLEKLKEITLRDQEDSPYSSRLYLDLPRLRIQDNLEYLQSGKLAADAKDKVNGALSEVKSWVAKATDDPERGLNFSTDYLYIKTDLQGNPISRVPIRGLYKMNIGEVSKDVLRSLLTYGYSIDRQKMLIDNQPIAKALLDTLSDPNNALDRLDVASSVLAKTRDKASMFLKRDTNRRLQLAKDYVSRTFYGQGVSEWEQDHPSTSKIVRGLMGQASRAFYALNPVSTLKNKLGMDFQKLIYTSGGKYISWGSMARGTITSAKTVIDYAANGVYTGGTKSLNLQLADAFDMSPDNAEKNAGKSSTRTAIKDLMNGTWMYSDRKLTEIQGSLDLGFSLLEFQTVDQIQPDGSTKQIYYYQAFELDDKNLVKLKDGINPEWGVTKVNHTIVKGDTLESLAKKYHMSVEELAEKNSIKPGTDLTEGDSLVISQNKKFNEVKRRIYSANKKLNGTMSKIDSPMAEKYMLYDIFTFSRKFGTGMFLSRYQMDSSGETLGDRLSGEVWDWDLNETSKGKYISFIRTTLDLIKDFKTYYPLMTVDEKRAAREVIMEGMMLFITGLLVSLLFGYSAGDEDRFKKLKERQERYGVAGWLANHALYQLIMVQRENQSFIPIPGVGADEWLDFTETSTIVVGPTLSLYSKILVDLGLILTGSDKAVYKQEVGPYTWQKEGRYKIWNHLGSVFGISGKNASPIWAVKKAEMFENLR